MNGTWVIFKKELKGFFCSPIYWIICGLLSLVYSFVFYYQLRNFGNLLMNYVMQQGVPLTQLNIHYGAFVPLLFWLNLLLIIIVPALTMRLFSEEKRMHTFELLMTSPVTSIQIVLGKYFATVFAVFGLVLLTFLYPLSTLALTKFAFPPLLISLLGFFIMGAIYAAMGLFASALTETGWIALVSAVLLNLALWFSNIAATTADSELSRKILQHISVSAHLSSLADGTIRTNGLIFFASIIVLFCFLTERVVESTRWR